MALLPNPFLYFVVILTTFLISGCKQVPTQITLADTAHFKEQGVPKLRNPWPYLLECRYIDTMTPACREELKELLYLCDQRKKVVGPTSLSGCAGMAMVRDRFPGILPATPTNEEIAIAWAKYCDKHIGQFYARRCLGYTHAVPDPEGYLKEIRWFNPPRYNLLLLSYGACLNGRQPHCDFLTQYRDEIDKSLGCAISKSCFPIGIDDSQYASAAVKRAQREQQHSIENIDIENASGEAMKICDRNITGRLAQSVPGSDFRVVITRFDFDCNYFSRYEGKHEYQFGGYKEVEVEEDAGYEYKLAGYQKVCKPRTVKYNKSCFAVDTQTKLCPPGGWNVTETINDDCKLDAVFDRVSKGKKIRKVKYRTMKKVYNAKAKEYRNRSIKGQIEFFAGGKRVRAEFSTSNSITPGLEARQARGITSAIREYARRTAVGTYPETLQGKYRSIKVKDDKSGKDVTFSFNERSDLIRNLRKSEIPKSLR